MAFLVIEVWGQNPYSLQLRSKHIVPKPKFPSCGRNGLVEERSKRVTRSDIKPKVEGLGLFGAFLVVVKVQSLCASIIAMLSKL